MRKHDKRVKKRTKYQPRNRIITTTDKGERSLRNDRRHNDAATV